MDQPSGNQPSTIITPNSTPETTPPPPEQPPVSPAPQTPAPPKPLEPSPVAQQPAAKPKSKKLWLVLAVILAVLLAGAAAYWFLVRTDNKTNQTATETKKDVPLLRYGTFEGTLNQFYPTTEDNTVTLLVNRQIFEGLVQFEDKTKVVPQLAQSWTNPDQNTWLFTLKPNVKFHTGNTLAPKDVVYSWEQIKKNELIGPLATSTIKNVEAVGDNQVKITTDGVDPILLNRLTNLPIMDSSAEGKADPKYGTGPFNLKEGTTPSATQIELVAFDDWHGGHVYVRELQVTVYPVDESGDTTAAESKALDDLKADKVDLVGFVTGERITTAKSGNLSLFPVDPPTVYKLLLNTKKANSPLANLKFRQALTYAVDVNALLKAIGRDQTGKVATQLVPQSIPGYNSDITAPKRDVDKAKQLVKDAGYANGATLTITVAAQSKDVADELAKQLKEANITLNVVALEDTSNFFTDIDAGKIEMSYYSEGSDVLDASDVFASILGTVNYQNQTASDTLAKAGQTLDQSTRLGYLQEVSKLLVDDVAQLPLYSNSNVWVTKQPFVMSTDILGLDIGVNFAKVYLSQ
jgi:peptide/nickel transport system substrate-binding protein